MSGAKSGDVDISPILILAGAPVVLAVAGTALVAGTAINAYLSARDRIRRQREDAMRSQTENVNRLADVWRARLAATEHSVKDAKIRSVAESLATMAAVGPVAVKKRAVDELMAYIPDALHESPIPPDDQWRADEKQSCMEVLRIMDSVLGAITEPLPDHLLAAISALHQIEDVEVLSGRVLQIRSEINTELRKIHRKREDDKAKAKQMLDLLPKDSPDDARKCFEDAARGDCPLTDELIQLFENMKAAELKREQEKKAAWRKHKEAASKVFFSTLQEMGYDVGSVDNNIFSTGSEAYIRNQKWEDGYCVKIRVAGEKIHFKAVKDVDSDSDSDESMERAWKGEFENVTERLKTVGLELKDIHVGSEPGDTEVLKQSKIPIDTKKKTVEKTSSSNAQHRYAVNGEKI